MKPGTDWVSDFAFSNVAGNEVSTSGTPCELAAWPQSMQTRDLLLTRSLPADASSLWPVLDETENARLFITTYGRRCDGPADLEAVLADHARDGNPHGGAFTITQRATQSPIGWLSLSPFTYSKDDGPMLGSLFLMRKRRVEQKTEALYLICNHALLNLGHESLSFYAGTLERTSFSASSMGNSLFGILRRQTVSKETHSMAEFADLYTIRGKDWPIIKLGIEAWLDSKGSSPLKISQE